MVYNINSAAESAHFLRGTLFDRWCDVKRRLPAGRQGKGLIIYPVATMVAFRHPRERMSTNSSFVSRLIGQGPMAEPIDSAPLKVVVFDCDGVLFDSKEANVHFYNHVMEYVGHPPVRPDQRDFIHMYPVKESLLFLLGSGPVHNRAQEYVQTIDFRFFNQYLRCEPGLVDILKIASTSYRTALATNRTISTREVLTHFRLEQYFHMVVSASDVSNPKPHPESMERIMEAFSAAPEEVLFIGDSPVDAALAQATGVIFVAYKNPALKAHIHIGHFHELLPVLAAARPEPLG